MFQVHTGPKESTQLTEITPVLIGCWSADATNSSENKLSNRINNKPAWSESTVALAGINSTPSRFSTSIANHCSKRAKRRESANHTSRPVPAKQLSLLKMY